MTSLSLIAIAATMALGMVITGLALEMRNAATRHMRLRIARIVRQERAEESQSLLSQIRANGAEALRPLINAAAVSLFAREKDRNKARRMLQRAGWRSEDALAVLAAIKIVAALLMGVIFYVVARQIRPDWPGFEQVLVGFGAAIIGGLAPEVILAKQAAARTRRLREALPDAIDLMVISAQAGQSLDMSLDRVARELPLFAPDLAQELALLNAEMQVLNDRAQALRHFGARIDIPEFTTFATALVQSIRYGASFAATLKALAADLRQSRMIAAEERAAKLPALLTLPLILFIMPPVFVVVAGPAILALVDVMSN